MRHLLPWLHLRASPAWWFALLGTTVVVGAARADPAPITPREPIVLFNGKDLSGFYTWLAILGREDPDRVFTVADQVDGAPAIRISGQHVGGIVTRHRFANYRLVAEYRWGNLTLKPTRRMSGILLHCQGEDGNYRADFKSGWMRSVEYKIMEGGTGDMILVGGYERGQATRLHPALKATVIPGPKVPRWSPDGIPTEFGAGRGTRIEWRRKDPEQENVTGFRGREDVERPAGEWNSLEAICDGGTIAFLLNGEKVNEGSDSTYREGSIMFLSEGAEIYFRRIEVHPLASQGLRPRTL